MDIKSIRVLLKMNQKEFAEYFEIPYRTLQNWELGLRTPPPYLINLILYKLKNEKML